MSDKIILGVHSNTKTQPGGGSADGFTDGHAWISVTVNGKTQVYGLWPDEHPAIVNSGQNNGDASDIRTGMEARSTAAASRYYELTPEEYAKLQTKLNENVTWGYTNNCSSWASETASAITGETIDANDYGGIETPRELGGNIRELEKTQNSSKSDPIKPEERTRSSIFGANDLEKDLQKANFLPEDLKPLYASADKHVRDLYTQAGIDFADGGQNTVGKVVYEGAKANLTEVEQMTVKNGQIHIAQKDPSGFGYTTASFGAVEAANTDYSKSMDGLVALSNPQQVASLTPEQNKTIDEPTKARSIA